MQAELDRIIKLTYELMNSLKRGQNRLLGAFKKDAIGAISEHMIDRDTPGHDEGDGQGVRKRSHVMAELDRIAVLPSAQQEGRSSKPWPSARLSEQQEVRKEITAESREAPVRRGGSGREGDAPSRHDAGRDDQTD
jgi:hypothetical protein